MKKDSRGFANLAKKPNLHIKYQKQVECKDKI